MESGDIIAFSGIENISIGDTVSDNENPEPLPRIEVDEPTVSMLFLSLIHISEPTRPY